MLKVYGAKVSLFFLILAQTVGFICVIMKMQHNQAPPPGKKPAHMHILIISTWRSGSSFTGEIFSQHPDVFYLMEPAWHVWTSFPKTRINVLQMAVRDLVRSVFLCDMTVFDAYMKQERTTSDLFQWEASRALCSPPACNFFQRSDIISHGDCRTICRLSPFDTVEKSCKTYSHVVIKEVRFFDWKSLYQLLEDPSLNLKVLHLVRDPRAVFLSRERAGSYLSPDNNIIEQDLPKKPSMNDKVNVTYRLMERICKSQVDMYLSATNHSRSAFDSRYMMIRYEDIVQNPIQKAKQMYEFSNLNFSNDLKIWIHNLTHGKSNGNNFVINSRNAVNVSKAWRNSLQFESVQMIQDLCSEAMKVFGYKFLKTKEAQHDLNYELLLPLPDVAKTKGNPFNLEEKTLGIVT
ncbi:carbohydrate sulfotransferase 4-like isoform 1-T2 [Leptodactylus fuscus]|uniref:carbohydrate sulfotransferase 4 n=1 Tax=Leptodactylus fuscus TaxID=238119 RepID=UPI003F4E6A72